MKSYLGPITKSLNFSWKNKLREYNINEGSNRKPPTKNNPLSVEQYARIKFFKKSIFSLRVSHDVQTLFNKKMLHPDFVFN